MKRKFKQWQSTFPSILSKGTYPNLKQLTLHRCLSAIRGIIVVCSLFQEWLINNTEDTNLSLNPFFHSKTLFSCLFYLGGGRRVLKLVFSFIPFYFYDCTDALFFLSIQTSIFYFLIPQPVWTCSKKGTWVPIPYVVVFCDQWFEVRDNCSFGDIGEIVDHHCLIY